MSEPAAPSAWPFVVECAALRFAHTANGRRAVFCDLKLHGLGLTVRDCRLVEPSGKAAFVGFPQKQYTTAAGPRFQDLIVFHSGPHARAFQAAAVAAVQEAIARHEAPQTPRP